MAAGRVTAFDHGRGLGEVTASDGAIHPFHCIEIADGTRDIEVGSDVTFELTPKLGRLEATALTRR